MRLLRSLSAALAVAALGLVAPAVGQDDKPALGLMGTIPIYWGEAEGLSDLLGDDIASAHWARAQLEAGYALRPLDTLTDQDLVDLPFLLLAQPRALSPAENVALDAWVRGGGRLLLFADPMLTGHTRYAIGDRRRPQDVILLSPILRHWGLQLEFDVDRPEGEGAVMAADAAIPVNRPGRLTAVGPSDCAIEAEGVLAACRLGSGAALVLADAAILDLDREGGAPVLDRLVRKTFGQTGDVAGMSTREELPGQ